MKIKVYTQSIPDGGKGPTSTFEDLQVNVLDDLENMEPGDTMVFTCHEMTKEELDALPEWGGY